MTNHEPKISYLNIGGDLSVLPSLSARKLSAALQRVAQGVGARMALAIAQPIELLNEFSKVLNAGAIPVVINPKLPPQHQTRIAVHLGCQSLRTDEGLTELSDPALNSYPSLQHVFCTSGTTSKSGIPKAFTYSIEQSLANARAHMKSLGFRPGDGSRILLPLPITHTFGMVAGVMGSTEYDLNLFIAASGLSPQSLLLAIQQHDIDSIYLTPSLMIQLNGFLARNRHLSWPSIKRVSIGSSVVYAKDLLRLMPFFPNSDFFATYGLTELGPRVSTFSAGKGRNPGSNLLASQDLPVPLGEPLEGVQLKVIDQRLWVKSPYRALNLGLDASEFLNTQDRVEVSPDFAIRVMGRADDTIIRSGINIYPDEVESKLAEILEIKACALVGIPSTTYGQIPVLAYELKDSAHNVEIEAKILDHLRNEVPESHVPVRLVLFRQIPKTDLGKIKRSMIAELIMKDQSLG